MKKLITIALLAAMLLTCFAGCGLKQGSVGAVVDAENVAYVAGNGFQAEAAGITGDLKTNVAAYKTDTLPVGDIDTWDGTTAEALTADAGDENLYVITTGAQLAKVIAEITDGNTFAGKTIKLGKHINLNNQAWTFATGLFKGTFDGQGYIIYGIKVTAAADTTGFLGKLAPGGVAKNLGLVYTELNGNSKKNLGFLSSTVTTSAETDKVTVQNIYCYVVSKNSGQNIGLVARHAAKGKGLVEISNVLMEGKMEIAGAQSAAIIGLIGGDVNISNCINNADITGNINYVGGITGQFAESATNTNNTTCTANITNCQNNGNLKGTYAVGGISAYMYYAHNELIITDCQNTGTITATSGTGKGDDVTYLCGGIVGYARANNANITVKTSENSGEVIGVVIGSSIAPSVATIIDCVDNGHVITPVSSGAENNKVIGYQTTAVSGGTYNLRYVATFNPGTAEKLLAGFVVTVKYTADGTTVSTQKEDVKAWATTAYKAINGGDKIYTAADYSAEYLYTLEIQNIPEAYTIADGTLQVIVTPITSTDAGTTTASGYAVLTHGSVIVTAAA